MQMENYPRVGAAHGNDGVVGAFHISAHVLGKLRVRRHVVVVETHGVAVQEVPVDDAAALLIEAQHLVNYRREEGRVRRGAHGNLAGLHQGGRLAVVRADEDEGDSRLVGAHEMQRRRAAAACTGLLPCSTMRSLSSMLKRSFVPMVPGSPAVLSMPMASGSEHQEP